MKEIKGEYYDICQGKTHNGRWVTPIFPLTDKGMLKMLSTGVAKALGDKDIKYRADWGHSIYKRVDKDNYFCVASNWDSGE